MRRFTIEQMKIVTYAFAVGDALGAPFEFKTVTEDEIRDRFNSDATLSFTDDTKLLLISNKALIAALSQYEPGGLSEFERTIFETTCHELCEWWTSGDLRGIGYTTQEAIRQLRRYHSKQNSFYGFSIDQTQYHYDNSAGNGILSRVLPLILKGFSPRDGWVNEFLRLTHLHVDGHKTAEALSDYIQQGQIPDRGFIDADIAENPKGFYSLETLLISSRACTCPDLQSVFYKSCVPEGDNDSTTALSFALKVIHTIKSNESDIPNLGLDRLISRLTKSDREEIESSLK